MFSFFQRIVVVGLVVLGLGACSVGAPDAAEPDVVRSHLAGELSIRAEVDTARDYRGFEVLVLSNGPGDPDTLGLAVTDSLGHFRLDVEAPERGIYPLLIAREGAVLKIAELAVAEGDTATFALAIPDPRPIRFRGSRENAAWTAYKNTKALHTQNLTRLVQSGSYTPSQAAQQFEQTATVLWSMRDNYAGTIGGEVAAAEAVVLLSGWNDSLVVARAREVEPSSAGYVDVARVARRAQTRRVSPDSGLALLQSFYERAPEADRPPLVAEEVMAYIEMRDTESARAAAERITRDFPDSEWAAWAGRALYDFDNLMPGMDAPAFAFETVGGDSVALADLTGGYVLLEFYDPIDEGYQREVDGRESLYRIAGSTPFEIVSVSLRPDSVLHEAFLGERDLPGRHVIAPDGPDNEIARLYNANVLPRRLLIDPEGRIVSKHEGPSIAIIQRELATLTRRDPGA